MAPDGDLVVVGGLEGTSRPQNHFALDFAAVKLSAESGEERWRFVLDGSAQDFDYARGVAVDAAGDVVVIGTLRDGSPTELLNPSVEVAIKLDGDDGRVLWRRTLDVAPHSGRPLVDAVGDVFLPIATRDSEGDRLAVLKLAGADGERVWTTSVGEALPRAYQQAFKVTLAPSGDVVAVGRTEDPSGAPALTAAAFDAMTGARRWQRSFEETTDTGPATGWPSCRTATS
jgi:outer membrane protein assembly factor BamB